MAGKFGSPSIWFLVDGYNMISNKIQALRFKITAEQEPTDGCGDSWREHTPTGMQSVELAQEGAFFDTQAAGIHAAYSGNTGTSRVGCLGFAGHTVGEPFVGFESTLVLDYEVLGVLGKLTRANAGYLVSGRLERGQVVQPLATKTADWNTKTLATTVDYTTDTSQQVVPITSSSVANPTVITTPVPHGLTTNDIVLISDHSGSTPTINGERVATVVTTTTFTIPVNVTVAGTGGTFVRANSQNGAVGFQHVTAFSGFTGFVGKIRDSADDTTYADLITFANVTSAPAKERATVAGTVDRYLSFDGNVTGTGSITMWCGCARL